MLFRYKQYTFLNTGMGEGVAPRAQSLEPPVHVPVHVHVEPKRDPRQCFGENLRVEP